MTRCNWLYDNNRQFFVFPKTLYTFATVTVCSPLRKGSYHRAFPLTRRCSTSLPGCVLPEVMVLNLIQWIFCLSFIQTVTIWPNSLPSLPWISSLNASKSGKQARSSLKSCGKRRNHPKKVVYHWGQPFTLLSVILLVPFGKVPEPFAEGDPGRKAKVFFQSSCFCVGCGGRQPVLSMGIL